VKTRFLVISNWHDKKTKQPKSSLAPVSEGIGKESGLSYAIVDTDKNTIVDGLHEVGSFVTGNMTFTVEGSEGTSSSQATSTRTVVPR
jgi:hypothetical protein